jgi:hypothetical protein
MSDVDARLTAVLQADAAPVHDVMFRVETLVRLERARFKRRLLLTVAAAAATAVLMAATAQALGAWMAADLLHVGIVALVSMVAMVMLLPGTQGESFEGARVLARTLDRWLYQ